MKKTALALQNLKEYINHTMEISGWERYHFDNIELIFNGHKESLFNYVFCKDGVTRENVITVLDFLEAKGWESTWPVDVHMQYLNVILTELQLIHGSRPQKAILNINNFTEPSNMSKKSDLHFVRVETNNDIEKYDNATSEIFYHNLGPVSKFISGVSKKRTDKVQFFLVEVARECVGTCAMYFGTESVGFYATGVFSRFRNQGIASQMISKKINIAQEHGYKYAVAHCMKSSVNLYQRLGFRMLGALTLYVSEIS